MMSPRMAAHTCTITNSTMPHIASRCQLCTSRLLPKAPITQPKALCPTAGAGAFAVQGKAGHAHEQGDPQKLAMAIWPTGLWLMYFFG